METTTNKKQIGNNGFTYTLMTGALLALLTLPITGFAGQQTQAASQEGASNSRMVSSDVAENYGDINDEEDGFTANTVDEKAEVVGKHDTNSHLMIAANGTADDGDSSGYGDNQDDG